MNNTFITADTHFGHANIIKYTNRPFKSVSDMNFAMIRNWNKTVKPEDTIFHLGDFAFYSKIDAGKLLSKLNGKRKILIIGNHDRKKRQDNMDKRIEFMKYEVGFDEVYGSLHIDNFFLNHVPIFLENVLTLNVGVDVWDFKPIPFPVTKQPMVLVGHIHDAWLYKMGNENEKI